MRKRLLYVSLAIIAVVVFAFAGCDMFGNDGGDTDDVVNYEVSFTDRGTDYTFSAGYSSDSAIAYYYSDMENTIINSSETKYFGEIANQDTSKFLLLLEGDQRGKTGTFTETEGASAIYVCDSSIETFGALDEGTDISMTITAYGVKGEPVEGTFNAGPNSNDISITNGRFEVLNIESLNTKERTSETVESPYIGDMAVQSTQIDTTSDSKALMFGNSEGTFTPASSTRGLYDGMSSRSDSLSVSTRATETSTFAASELLRRYTPEELSTSVSSYSFSSFKTVADIFLKSTDGHEATILNWGGDQTDLSNYVDLATGVLESTDDYNELEKRVYDTIIMQINAPAETIVPDFVGDEAKFPEIDTYSWTDIKPFYSTDSSAQHVIISTFVAKPFAQWLGGDVSHLEADYPQLAEYNDLEDWAFRGTLDQDFFDAVKQYTPQSDPNSGEAMVFLPMYESIDLTNIDSVTISLEMFMKDLIEVYEYDETIAPYDGATPYRDGSNRIHVLSSGKTYTDEEGNVYYAPLPIKVTYSENENGMNVNPK